MKSSYTHSLIKLVFILYGLTLFSCTQNNSSNTNKTAIKTMTYNTYSNRNSSIEKIAEIIRNINPDLVSLQEVERFTEINPYNTPAKLAELTGMNYHYFIHALDIEEGGDYGNVILSKYPITDSITYKLHGVDADDYVRSFGYIKIEKDGRQFYFAATHLDHKHNDASRIKMVREILNVVKGLDAPIILGGDMNAQPTQKTMTTLSGWFNIDCVCNLKPTVPAPGPAESTIDYLISGPDNAFTIKDYRVYYEAGGASDHFPVIATFELD